MLRTSHLLIFAGRLSEAAAAGNWDALARVDGEIALTVPRLAARGPWSAGEQAALDQLRDAHREAYGRCARELGLVQERIEALQVSRAGLRAYAENHDFEESTA